MRRARSWVDQTSHISASATRKGVPVPALRQKANEFIAAELITEVHADHILQTIEQIRGAMRIVNDGAGADGADECGSGAADRSGVKLSREQLLNELADREEKMKSGAEADGVTDQFRVYEHIIGELQSSTGFCRTQHIIYHVLLRSARKVFGVRRSVCDHSCVVHPFRNWQDRRRLESSHA